MSVTTTCRDISELNKAAQTACRLFLSECDKAGVKVFITETYRSQARQNYLYEQGRTRPGQVVTWTKNSNHISRLAWDIAVSKPSDLYDISTLNKAGTIARKLGITWGGDWKNNIDRPHFEVKANWKEPTGNVAYDKPPSKPETPKKEVIRMFKPSSATLKSSVINLIEQAVKDKIVDGKWLTQAKSGTLSLDDAFALHVEIESRRKVMTK